VSTTKIVPDGEVGKTVLSTVICVELPLLRASPANVLFLSGTRGNTLHYQEVTA
jgi:hypothetical protein